MEEPYDMYHSKTVRYCPSCDVARRGSYTSFISNPGLTIEFCEHDNLERGNGHRTCVIGGIYAFDLSSCDDFCGNACLVSRPGDDGVACCEIIPVHSALWGYLIRAMEKEANAGVFDHSVWAPTFPRRAAELVEARKGVVTAALANELPAALIGVVCGYL